MNFQPVSNAAGDGGVRLDDVYPTQVDQGLKLAQPDMLFTAERLATLQGSSPDLQ